MECNPSASPDPWVELKLNSKDKDIGDAFIYWGKWSVNNGKFIQAIVELDLAKSWFSDEKADNLEKLIRELEKRWSMMQRKKIDKLISSHTFDLAHQDALLYHSIFPEDLEVVNLMYEVTSIYDTCTLCYGKGIVNCSECGGAGKLIKFNSETCSHCDGSGKMRSVTGSSSVSATCPKCNGTGIDEWKRDAVSEQALNSGMSMKIPLSRIKCDLCNGTGSVTVGTSNPKVNIVSCSYCNGIGIVKIPYKISCPYCDGGGTVFCGNCQGNGALHRSNPRPMSISIDQVPQLPRWIYDLRDRSKRLSQYLQNLSVSVPTAPSFVNSMGDFKLQSPSSFGFGASDTPAQTNSKYYSQREYPQQGNAQSHENANSNESTTIGAESNFQGKSKLP